jgi:predicted AAA+ superfamily ATPase
MALSNRDRIGKALESLNSGLKPFVEREMKAVHGEKWVQEALQSGLKEEQNWDTYALLTVMWNQWNAVFGKPLGRAERSIVNELRDVRNKWAHQEAFTTDDAYRALDSIARLLTAISATEAEDIERQRQEILRARFEEQARKETKRSVVAPIEGKTSGGLKPWREIMTPHPDVASGRYQQAEFAADLWQVYLGEGSDEYRHPTEFYRRTFLTDGLQHLLIGALRRLSGSGGDPVVELQTNFGGGKTHSMLALYHLFSGTPPGDLPGVEQLIADTGVPNPQKVRRAILVGTKIGPGQVHKKKDGTSVRTLWGEIAWQLGGKEGYEIVRKADETSTNPGDLLKELFNRFAPCLVLIDEWVAYARQLYMVNDLPAGTFDTHFTFAQTLSESAKNAAQTLLVVSIPSSDNEIGGEGGRAALDRLKNAVGRVESPWRPASAEEGFEIVRRRLFQPITEPHLFPARDAVVRAFGDLYRTQFQEFPLECREADYERRLQAAYPIHPELFDRLFNDWSSLDKFQRTRGVLRLMAAVIHSLWEREDRSLLILPASVPIDDPAVQFELTRYLEDPWVPVIEKDIDGPHSLPLQLDRENPNLGRYSACRRVSRTIYLGSAPTLRAANRGLEERNIKVGCVQPGESVATFGDALRRIADKATFLYVDARRYWYSTQPSVTRLAEDRATAHVNSDDVVEEISRRLRDEIKVRGDFPHLHIYVSTTGDIPDDREASLIILGPTVNHAAKDVHSSARKAAEAVLDTRGTSPRIYKNGLVFLAADRTRLAELEQAIRSYLAWTSIQKDKDSLNLDGFQANQVKNKVQTCDETVAARVPETYQWLLVPGQPDPTGPIDWQEVKVQGAEALALKASRKLKNDELLIARMAGIRLRHEMNKVPLWRGDNVSVKQLAEDFAQYLYLPRLTDSRVVAEAARDGVSLLTWNPETFAYADAWDEGQRRYLGLRAAKDIDVTIEGVALLVKPDVAAHQMAGDRVSDEQPRTPGEGVKPTDGEKPIIDVIPKEKEKKTLTRFYASADLDATRLGRDVGKIAEEVVQHLTSLVGAKAEISLDIRVEVPDGVPDNVVRTVTENCRTMKFRTHEFEAS